MALTICSPLLSTSGRSHGGLLVATAAAVATMLVLSHAQPSGPLQFNLYFDDSGLAILTQISALLGPQPLLYLGTVDASTVEQGCQYVEAGVFNIPATVTPADGGQPQDTTLNVITFAGCDASDMSPSGVQAVLQDSTTGRQMAVVCGTDATQPVWSCSVYVGGDDVAQAYSQATSGGNRRMLQDTAQCSQPACIEGCICMTNGNNNHCFAADSTVFVEGAPVRLDTLAAGDKVEDPTSPGTRSAVLYFGHRSLQTLAAFNVLSVRHGSVTRRLSATDLHVLRAWKGTAACGAGVAPSLMYAKHVRVGDVMEMLAEDGVSVVCGTVVSQQREYKVGVVNPVTAQPARVVVDGVVASSYAASTWAQHLDGEGHRVAEVQRHSAVVARVLSTVVGHAVSSKVLPMLMPVVHHAALLSVWVLLRALTMVSVGGAVAVGVLSLRGSFPLGLGAKHKVA